MSVSLGIDVGGTFTDLVALDHQSGHGTIWKESTTPDDPARGVVDGIRRLLAEHRIAPADISRVVHATTLFTNALIERKGAPTGLLTTAGFADVLEIGRERKYELYDLAIEMPRPLVPRPWRREAMERLAPDGSVEIRLDIDAALREVEWLVGQGVRSLAIVFLHAYANPAHEQQARGGDRAALSAAFAVAVIGDSAGDPGVSAHQHHGCECLCAAAGGELSRSAGGGADAISASAGSCC